jgi:hypothetical protein
MFFISCSTESVSEDLTTNLTATAAKAKKPRPIKNTYVGIDRYEAGVLVGANFSGNMSHAGNITGMTTTTNFYFISDSEAVQTSDDVIIAANGDKIYTFSEVTITFAPETLDPSLGGDGSYSAGTYTGGFDIDGGTGRFAEAKGREDIVDFGVFSNGMAQHKAAGWISY